MDEFWVFGYGSLMWRPGFDYIDASKARLHGFHRALCVRSFVHRGTPDSPGLVLGLDKGGSCLGIAFQIEPGLRSEVMAYLRARELVNNVYKERLAPVRLHDGRRVSAVAYVVDRDHIQYAGALSAGDAAQAVRGSVGQSGRNEEYVVNTVNHLRQLHIRDHWLEKVAGAIGADHAGEADTR